MTSGNNTKLLIYAERGRSSSCAIRYVLSELWYIFVSDCIHNPSGNFNVETTLFQWITATLNQRWNVVAYMYKSCNFVSTSKVEMRSKWDLEENMSMWRGNLVKNYKKKNQMLNNVYKHILDSPVFYVSWSFS